MVSKSQSCSVKVWHRYALLHRSNSQAKWFKIVFFVSSETSVYNLHSAVSCKEYVSICSYPALGDFDEPKRSSLTMFGVLTSAVRIYQDRLGYGIYSGPIGTAVFMITVKWVSLRNIWCCSYSAFKSRAPNKLDEEQYFAHIDNMETQNFIIYHKCFHKVLQYCFCFAPVTKNEGKKRTLSRQKCLHSTSGARVLLRCSCFDASLLFRGKHMNINGYSNWSNTVCQKSMFV